jgi:hypothetical protein
LRWGQRERKMNAALSLDEKGFPLVGPKGRVVELKYLRSLHPTPVDCINEGEYGSISIRRKDQYDQHLLKSNDQFQNEIYSWGYVDRGVNQIVENNLMESNLFERYTSKRKSYPLSPALL